MLPESGMSEASPGLADSYTGESSPESGNGNHPHCPTLNLPSPSLPFTCFFFPRSEKDWKKLRRCILASGKGFIIGAGLKGGLAAFSILARLRSRRGAGMVSNKDAVVMAAKETLRYGLFLGTFAGTYASVDECVAAFGGADRTASWRALLAGLAAGPSLLLTGVSAQHTSLAVYILMRAAVLASRCGIKSKRFGRICKPLTWSHGDIFLMCLSASQILSAYILKQDSLPSSYKSFLNKHGGKDAVILQGVKEILTGMPFTNLEGIEKYYKSKGMDLKLDPKMKIPYGAWKSIMCWACLFFSHPSLWESITSLFSSVFDSCINRSSSGSPEKDEEVVEFEIVSRLCETNEVVNCIGMVHHWYKSEVNSKYGSHLQRYGCNTVPVTRPYSILGKSLHGIARSSLFLSVFTSSAWMYTCLLFQIFKRCNVPILAMGTFPAGLALAIEKKNRRIELSLYCFARAIEIFSKCMVDAGHFPQSKRLKRADVVIFSISTSIIMHCYAREREVFRSKYLNVLDWVFGLPPDCYKPD